MHGPVAHNKASNNRAPGVENIGWRKVRSFVRRGGRLTSAQQHALDELMPKYGLTPVGACFNFDSAFSKPGPVYLEVGFGNGESLFQMAQSHPERNYLGVEIHRPGIGRLLRLLDQNGVENVRVISGDAKEVLADFVSEGSLDGIYLFFPDPWQKKRHHKRRLVQSDFVHMVQRSLKFGGVFHMATDWQDYAEHMMTIMESSPGFVNLAGKSQFSKRPEYRPITKFERRGERLGHGVWDLIYIRG